MAKEYFMGVLALFHRIVPSIVNVVCRKMKLGLKSWDGPGDETRLKRHNDKHSYVYT